MSRWKKMCLLGQTLFFFSCASKGVLDCKEEKNLPEKLEQK